MVVHIEDSSNCLRHLFPQFVYRFELDHSSGHNAERPDGLSTTNSVINLGWVGKQRKMRSSVWKKNDVGILNHSRRITIGET